jgi:hypothetical protein
VGQELQELPAENPQLAQLTQEVMSLRMELLVVQTALQRQTQDAEELAASAPVSVSGVTGMPGTESILRWGSGSSTYPGAWEIAFDGDEATCSDCVYMRGPVTVAPTVAALTLALEDAYIAAHINLADGTAELVEGASIAAVTDAAPQDDDTTYKLLLYHAVKTDGAWAVDKDYRNAPQLGVRL